MLFVSLFAIILAACAPPDRPILSEVLYDAVGDDTGWEYVEIFNPTAHAAPLAGLRIEAGDGAGAARWTLRWTGRASDTLRAGARFVVGGAKVLPAPDAVASLDLQNGPDAVRLVWPDGATEVLGWGALALPEYFCGAPAPDVSSGDALARIPDAADLGSNALDFRAQPPSPGRANQAGRNVALASGTLRLEPEQPVPGAVIQLSAIAINRGALALAAGQLAVEFGLGDSVRTSVAWGAPLAPGDSALTTAMLAAPRAGKYRAWARASLAGDERADDDADSLAVRVGPGPLAITEIQFHPPAGAGEWVEVRCVSEDPCDLDAFTLSDRGAARGVPDESAGSIEPESLAVLCEDRTALLAGDATLDSTRVVEVHPWAALNNSDDDTGVADVVVVREVDGTPSDRVPYSAAGVPAGVTIERVGDRWRPSSDPMGTPLQPPRSLPPLAARFEFAPRRVRVGGAAPRIEWALPWPNARVSVDAYDLAGRRVAWLLPEVEATGRGERVVHTDGLPAGLYVVVLHARPESGDGSLTESRAVRIEGAGP